MKKNILVVLLLAGFFYKGIAQQIPLQSQYLWNQFIINPAVAGTQEGVPVFLSYRNQWNGLEGAPVTQLAGIHGAVNDKAGLGLLAMSDKTGPIKRTSFELGYSYRVKVTDKYKLSFGLAPCAMMFSLKKADLIFDQPDAFADAVLGESVILDATAGLHFSAGNYFAGISVPQIMGSRIWEGDRTTYARLKRNYLFYAGYTFTINEQLAVQPSLYTKYTLGAPLQADVNVRATYKQFAWIGCSYRANASSFFSDAFVAMIGIEKHNITAGYAFDYSFGKLMKNAVGSHELFLSYTILKRVKATPQVQVQ